MTTTDANRHPSINFDETELRLGLPGGRGVDKADAASEISKSRSNGKRGFSETEVVDLKLHLSSSSTTGIDVKEKVVKPPSKAQVVGWPPVRSFRKNAMATQKANTESATGKADGSNGTTTTTTATASTAALVKVSMDGAPYLRKVDLKMYKSYQELSNALVTMFSSFTSDKKDSINHSKSTDSRNGSDFVPTYEDKDGDWMLVGDVPWEMFVESCKRMRIMTSGSEALRS